MTGAGFPWATLLAGAGGVLAAHGAALVVSAGARLPGPARAAAVRLAAEVRETAEVVRTVGAGHGPFPPAAVRRLRVAAALVAAVA